MSLPEAALRTLALLSTALLLGTPDRVLNGQTKTVASTQGGVGVKRMEIESSAWNGRKTIRQRMVIRATSTGHAAKDRRVDSDAIRELVALLNAPPLPLNLKALGINQDWLRQNGFNDEAGFLKTVNQYYSDSVIWMTMRNSGLNLCKRTVPGSGYGLLNLMRTGFRGESLLRRRNSRLTTPPLARQSYAGSRRIREPLTDWRYAARPGLQL